METMQFAYDGQKQISVRSHANLYIQGWDKAEVQILPTDLHATRVDDSPQALQIILTADAEIDLPAGARLLLEHGSGDVWLRGLTGLVEINKVSGDLYLQDLGTVQVGWLDGDFRAQNINGALQVHKISRRCQRAWIAAAPSTWMPPAATCR